MKRQICFPVLCLCLIFLWIGIQSRIASPEKVPPTAAALTPSPTLTLTPTAKPTPTPTPTPSPTAAPTPTPTPSPTPQPTPVDIFALEIAPPEAPNAAVPLVVPTYDGSNQTTHPKVLYFPDFWNGFPYWMVHTPYPHYDNTCENPSVSVSYDGIYWFDPPGLENPVSGLPPTFNNRAHYSDGHLLMRGDTMELWFRHNGGQDPERIADNDGAEILRVTSTDGIHWTEPEVMIPKSGRKAYLCPVVIYEDGFYALWYSDLSGKLFMIRSATGETWSDPVETDLAYPGYRVWHQDIIQTDLGYEIVYCGKVWDDPLTRDNQQHEELFYAMSRDGVHWTAPVKIMTYPQGTDALDNNSIYRSSLVKTEEGYRLYYAGMDNHHRCHIFLSRGKTISTLKGYDPEA